jgi:hypothetical protein
MATLKKVTNAPRSAPSAGLMGLLPLLQAGAGEYYANGASFPSVFALSDRFLPLLGF